MLESTKLNSFFVTLDLDAVGSKFAILSIFKKKKNLRIFFYIFKVKVLSLNL